MTDPADQLDALAKISQEKGCTLWLMHGAKAMRAGAAEIRRLRKCQRQDDAGAAPSAESQPERSPRSTNESGIGLFDALSVEGKDG